MAVFHKIQTYHNNGLIRLRHESAGNSEHSNWVGEKLRLLFPITLLHHNEMSKPIVMKIVHHSDRAFRSSDPILKLMEWEKVEKVILEIHVDAETDQENVLLDPVIIRQIAGLSKWHEIFWAMAQKLSEGRTKIQKHGIKVQCVTAGSLPEVCRKDIENGEGQNQQVLQEILALEPIRPSSFLLGLTEHGSFVKIGKVKEMKYRYGSIRRTHLPDPGELMIGTDHGSYSFREAGCESK